MAALFVTLFVIGCYVLAGSVVAAKAAILMNDRGFKHDSCPLVDGTGITCCFAMLIGLFWPITVLWVVAAQHIVRENNDIDASREAVRPRPF